MSDIFLSPGVRTPFVKGGGGFAALSALALSVPVAKTMAERAHPDFLVWSQVIPDATVVDWQFKVGLARRSNSRAWLRLKCPFGQFN